MKLLLLAIVIAIPCIVLSQPAAPIRFDKFRLNNTRDSITDTEFSATKKILNEQFSALITGQSKNTFGSYAGFDPVAGDVSFASSHLSKKNGSLFTMKGNGGVSDGFVSLFNNSTFNTNVGLDLQLHFMRLNKRALEYDYDSSVLFNDKVRKLEYEFDVKNAEISCSIDSLNMAVKKAKVDKSVKSVKDSIELYKTDPLKRLTFQLELDKTIILADSVDRAIRDIEEDKYRIGRLLRNRILEKLKALNFDGVSGFRFGWFSVGYKVSNNKFKTFNPGVPLGKQIGDTSFLGHTLKLQFSEYNLQSQAFKSYFWDIGLNFEHTDNFSSLKKRELTEMVEYGAVPGQRQTKKQYNAYEGSYLRNLKALTLFADFYYFLFRNNKAALHINPEWTAKTSSKPLTNLYTGFMLAVKSNKTANTVVNFELYYKFLDLFKTTETEYDLFERNNVGIRIAFPITFKYNKID